MITPGNKTLVALLAASLYGTSRFNQHFITLLHNHTVYRKAIRQYSFNVLLISLLLFRFPHLNLVFRVWSKLSNYVYKVGFRVITVLGFIATSLLRNVLQH